MRHLAVAPPVRVGQKTSQPQRMRNENLDQEVYWAAHEIGQPQRMRNESSDHGQPRD